MQRLRTRRWALVAVVIAVGGGALAAASLGATPAPLVATRYSLSVDGYEIGSFSDLKTITSEMTPTTTTSTGSVAYTSSAPRSPPSSRSSAA